MLNYEEIVTCTAAHRAELLTNAEQQHLVDRVAAFHPHPVNAWLGRQLIRWGRQLQGGPPPLPGGPVTEGV